MTVQLNTDKNIQGTENLEAFVSEKLKGSLKHLTSHITRIEVHLSDQNADKGGPDDVQCKIEARVENMQPVTVTSKSDSKEKALVDAIDKLKALLNTRLGKLKNK
ncbi:MAG: HPF/RaiA family ribosome-associated protein [Bacteroidia bacterium]|nr:HPF/RaiA family ribosome-associated protein [Bacteroidia bacterium]